MVQSGAFLGVPFCDHLILWSTIFRSHDSWSTEELLTDRRQGVVVDGAASQWILWFLKYPKDVY